MCGVVRRCKTHEFNNQTFDQLPLKIMCSTPMYQSNVCFQFRIHDIFSIINLVILLVSRINRSHHISWIHVTYSSADDKIYMYIFIRMGQMNIIQRNKKQNVNEIFYKQVKLKSNLNAIKNSSFTKLHCKLQHELSYHHRHHHSSCGEKFSIGEILK